MKKILSFLILLTIGLSSYGQPIPIPQPSAAGIGYKRLLADSTLFFPAQSGLPSGLGSLKSNNINRKPSFLADTTGNYVYWFNPKDSVWRRFVHDADLTSYVPYTGSVASVNLGEFRLSSRSVATDSILAHSSAGGRIVSNSGNLIAMYGAGGGSEWVNYGFAGYDLNRSGSFTDLSFVNKKWADSLLALKYGGTVTINTIPKATGANTFGNSNITDNGTLVTFNSNTLWAANKWIGMNNTTPLAPIHVGERSVLNSSLARILVAGNYNNSYAANGHGFSDGSNLSRNNGLWAYAAYDGRVDVTGSGIDADHYVSFQHGPTFNFSGNLKDNFGVYTTSILNAGNIENNYGVYVANPIMTGGNIATNFGMYLANQTVGTGANYSIYSEGGRMYHAGDAQFDGKMTLAATGENLRLKSDGSSSLDGALYVGGTGNLFLSNFSGTRGYATLANGNGYYFGGNFGIGTTSPTRALDVVGMGIFSQSVTADSIIKIGGTSSQFLKADGSTDNSTYAPLSGADFTGAISSTGTIDGKFAGSQFSVSNGGTKAGIVMAGGSNVLKLSDWATASNGLFVNVANGNTEATGSFTSKKIIGSSTTPSVTLGANITGSISVVGTDLSGTITVTVTSVSGLATNNELFTLSYNSAYTSTPHVVFSPASPNAATIQNAAGGLYLKSSGVTSFQIAIVNSYTTPASATYTFTYHVIQ